MTRYEGMPKQPMLAQFIQNMLVGLDDNIDQGFRAAWIREKTAKQDILGRKINGPLKDQVCRLQTEDPVHAKIANLLAQTAVARSIPLAFPMDNAVGIEVSDGSGAFPALRIRHLQGLSLCRGILQRLQQRAKPVMDRRLQNRDAAAVPFDLMKLLLVRIKLQLAIARSSASVNG